MSNVDLTELTKTPVGISVPSNRDDLLADNMLGPKVAAARLRRSHDARFGGRCVRRSLATTQDGDETVVYCETCKFVVARFDGTDGDADE